MNFASRMGGRMERYAYTAPGSVPLAQTLPQSRIANISAPGLASANTQFHYGNNFLFQETQTKLSGRHAFRYGVEFLRQLITQARGANDLGSISFTNAVGLFRLREFPGRLQRTLRRRQQSFWRPGAPPEPVPPELLFSGQLEGDAHARLDAGAALRELRPAGQRAAVSGLLRIRPGPVSGAARSESRQQQLRTGLRPGVVARPAFGLAGKTVRRRKDGLARRIPDQLRRLLHADDLPRARPLSTPNAISTNTHRAQYRPRLCPTGSSNCRQRQPLRSLLDSQNRNRQRTSATRTPSAGLSGFSGNCPKTFCWMCRTSVPKATS